MCGIAGSIAKAPLSEAAKRGVRAASAAQFHRGPDGSGEFESPGGELLLAVRRLAIIDLPGGAQPLSTEDQSLVLVANGEIYNFVELRARLEKKHRFRTKSDCEVILHAYAEYGLDFVRHLRGMFAFALWDARQRRLILARDRLGEKPLYLAVEKERVTFASELGAMLASRAVSFRLSPNAVDRYLHYGWVPEPRTMIEGLTKLRPGHLLIVDAEPFRVEEHCWFRLEDAEPVSGDPATILRAELETIAEQTLRSDVPVGIALSGGLDSSLLAALSVRHAPGRMRAFAVGYPDRPHQDERHLARRFAEQLGLEFHELELQLPELVDTFPELARLTDDPIADIAAFGYYELSRCAREHGCPVLVQGQGGDELFWGYRWAALGVRATRDARRGRPWNAAVAALHEVSTGSLRGRLFRLANVIGGGLEGWKRAPPSEASALISYQLTDGYQIAERAAFDTYTPSFARAVRANEAPDELCSADREGDPALQVLARLCSGYLLENGLAQGDRLSMANSVELRAPLCDYRLAELSVGLQKVTPCFERPHKQWLRDAARGLLPEEILNRPKRGFNPPVTRWLAALTRRYGAELERGTLVEMRVLRADAARALRRPRWRFSPERELGFRWLVLEYWCRAMSAV